MVKAIAATAILSSAITALAMWAGVSQTVKLENAKVRVTEIVHAPGAARERHIRPADQVIVFLDDCEYERTDPKTGEKTVRKRKSGEVIWHYKGEDAPVLVNKGSKPYRTVVVELK